MQLTSDVSLLPYNTFGLDAHAAHFVEVHTVEELRAALQKAIHPVLILGGGSNLLFAHDPPGLVIKNSIRGIEEVHRSDREVRLKVGAGENWHQFVLYAVAQDLGGVENLSLIPGTVGASPVQNIGAYGVELKDVFVELEAVELATGQLHTFRAADCQFGYRDSIFKRSAKGRYCITAVTFALSRSAHHLRLGYGDLQRMLTEQGVSQPTIADVSRAVIHIRSAKLPDPAVIGNCGSFFKNPETGREVLERIQVAHPQAPHFDLPDGRVKIPAGWLIEQCGWKGKRVGHTGCYEKQALVLVNYGGATGAEVQALAQAIIQSVEDKFGVRLEAEVNIL
ncbi:MAG: UDP-N-acetylmuramate dehydrogenase [Saprospiraceae bacterium]|nr:UDP-N-acetylmuramate dehydrogenase [Saprospiraceae bacterium]